MRRLCYVHYQAHARPSCRFSHADRQYEQIQGHTTLYLSQINTNKIIDMEREGFLPGFGIVFWGQSSFWSTKGIVELNTMDLYFCLVIASKLILHHGHTLAAVPVILVVIAL